MSEQSTEASATQPVTPPASATAAKPTGPTPHERLATLEKKCAIYEQDIAGLKAIIASIGAAFGHGSNGAASERELDSPKGDAEVKLQPRDWSGPSMKGRKFSECDPDFLEQLAEMYDYFEARNRPTDAKKADFDKRSARLARGWAKRLHEGWKAPEKPERRGIARGPGLTGGISAGRGLRSVNRPVAPAPAPTTMPSARANPFNDRDADKGDAFEPEDDDDLPLPVAEPPSSQPKQWIEDDEDEDDPPLMAGGAT